jgi:hypothetical protein
MTELITLEDICPRTLLSLAAGRGALPTLKMLYKRGYQLKENEKPWRLIYAIEEGHVHVLWWWSRTGQITLKDCRRDGNKALLRATICGSSEALRWLQSMGISLADCLADKRILVGALERQNVGVLRWLHAMGVTGEQCRAALSYGFLDRIMSSKNASLLKWLKEVHVAVRTDKHLLNTLVRGASSDLCQVLSILIPSFESRNTLLDLLQHAGLQGLLSSYSRIGYRYDGPLEGLLLLSVQYGVVPMTQWLVDHGVALRNKKQLLDCTHAARHNLDPRDVRECAAVAGAPRGVFADAGLEEFWLRWRDQRLAVVVLAGRRGRPRLPGELLEYIRQEF